MRKVTDKNNTVSNNQNYQNFSIAMWRNPDIQLLGCNNKEMINKPNKSNRLEIFRSNNPQVLSCFYAPLLGYISSWLQKNKPHIFAFRWMKYD